MFRPGLNGGRRAPLVIAAAALGLAIAGCSTATTDDAAPPTTALNLEDVYLAPDGLGEVLFGASEQEVIDALNPFLGGFDTDSEWIDGRSGIYGSCPEHLRVISWGSLAVFFTPLEGDTPRDDLESGRFFAYTYGFDYEDALAGVDDRGLDLATIESVGLDSPGSVLDTLDVPVEFAEDPDRDILTFAIEPTEDPHLRGTLAGPDRSDPITFIETSTGCE